MHGLVTRPLGAEADVIAPDGCEVRLLATTPRGSMAHFTLGPGQTAHAVAHRTVEEVWYFLSGHGRMWRRLGERSEIAEVAAGISIALPTGPGEDEAYFVDGAWEPNLG
jgi:mannose-6-phosphate isomerase-like protein (cupin superfamily)